MPVHDIVRSALRSALRWSLAWSLALAAPLAAPLTAAAQPPSAARAPAWSVTIGVGGFVRGNKDAVSNWLQHNAYGVDEPPVCTFDVLFNRQCAPTSSSYPKARRAGLLGVMATVRRRVSERVALEVVGATEQSGTMTGRCDDQVVPKDSRCTVPFVTVDFGGASFASLAVLTSRHVRIGAGPAILFANWTMTPAHLPGLWLDATAGLDRVPVFVRAQYRVYRSTGASGETGFTAFHPSTLLLGLGVSISLEESERE